MIEFASLALEKLLADRGATAVTMRKGDRSLQTVGRRHLRAIDLFCGAGGSSWGARAAGVDVVAGFDRWGLAGKVYQDNFPSTKFFSGSLEDIDPARLESRLGQVDLLLASPECTNHSPAKGSSPRCEKSKGTAFQVVRFAAAFEPRWIVVENVVNMRNWSRYPEFVEKLQCLGYEVREHIFNAADFAVPQSRRRLFLLCDRDLEPASIPPPSSTPRSARSILQRNAAFSYSPLRTEQRAEATIERAERAIQMLGQDEQFLLVYYGSDGGGGWQTLDSHLRTVTTLDRFAHVKPSPNGHLMRMLQVPEIRTAMGMHETFKINHGSRRDRIHMLGNAVCPPVMKAIVDALVANATSGGK